MFVLAQDAVGQGGPFEINKSGGGADGGTAYFNAWTAVQTDVASYDASQAASGYQREWLVVTGQSITKTGTGMWLCNLTVEVKYYLGNVPKKWDITSPANLAVIPATSATWTLGATKPAGVLAYVTLHKWDPAAANPADPTTPGNWVPIDLGDDPAGSWNIALNLATATKAIGRPDKTGAKTYTMTLFEDTNGDHVTGTPKDTITFTW